MTYAHPSITAAGVAASHALIDKICIDCGDAFEAPKNRAKFMVRCPGCQREYDAECNRERAMQHYRLDPERNIGGAYKIVADPGRSWTPGSSLDLGDIRTLAKAGYMESGTRWSNGKKTVEVVGSRIWEV